MACPYAQIGLWVSRYVERGGGQRSRIEHSPSSRDPRMPRPRRPIERKHRQRGVSLVKFREPYLPLSPHLVQLLEAVYPIESLEQVGGEGGRTCPYFQHRH